MGPNKLKPHVTVRLPGPEVQGSGNHDEDMGHRLVYIIILVDDDIIRQTLKFLAIAIAWLILAEFELYHAAVVWLQACPLSFLPSALFHSPLIVYHLRQALQPFYI